MSVAQTREVARLLTEYGRLEAAIERGEARASDQALTELVKRQLAVKTALARFGVTDPAARIEAVYQNGQVALADSVRQPARDFLAELAKFKVDPTPEAPAAPAQRGIFERVVDWFTMKNDDMLTMGLKVVGGVVLAGSTVVFAGLASMTGFVTAGAFVAAGLGIGGLVVAGVAVKAAWDYYTHS